MHQASLGAGDQLAPVLVDVLAQLGCRLADLTVHGQLDEVLEFLRPQPRMGEIELHGSLFHALGEVALIEREAKLPVLENVVGARLVVASACSSFHGIGPRRRTFAAGGPCSQTLIVSTGRSPSRERRLAPRRLGRKARASVDG